MNEDSDLAFQNEVKYILADPRGRRFFFRLMERGRVFGVSETLSQSPEQTAYCNGARDLAMSFLTDAEEQDNEGLTNAIQEYLRNRDVNRCREKNEEKEEAERKKLLWMM